MYTIGLTGGIASGKSTVSGMLRSFGAYIIDADRIAKELVKPGSLVLQEIVNTFDVNLLLTDGNLNRIELANIVYNHPSAMELLNKIMHPVIQKEIIVNLEKAKLAGINVVVLDVPLLIEKEWYSLANTVWLVYVNQETQLQRLMQRNNLGVAEASMRIKAQMSLEVKRTYADVIIDNSGSLEQTKTQVVSAWASIPRME